MNRPGRVVVVGDAMVDVYVDAVAKGVAREAPVDVMRVEAEWVAPGGAANTAANLATLGASVTLVAAIGEDEWGDRLAAALAARDVEFVAIRDARRPTTRKVRVRDVGHAGARPRIVGRYDVESVEEAPSRAIVEAITSAGASAQAIVVSDSSLGAVGDAVVAQVNSLAKGIPVFVDSRRQSMRFREVFALTPNDDEAAQAVGLPFATDADARRGVRELALRTHAKTVLVTRGARGVALWANGEAILVPAAAMDGPAVDTTGAGDSAVAAYAAACLQGATPADAAAYANVAGALAVRAAGTVALSRHALHEAFVTLAGVASRVA